LAIVSGDETVSVLANNGRGSFRPKVDYQSGPDPADLAIGDLNGDANPDLAVPHFNAKNAVSALINKGNGSFRTRRDYTTGYHPTSVAIADER